MTSRIGDHVRRRLKPTYARAMSKALPRPTLTIRLANTKNLFRRVLW
jgi:hypothetical protein